MSQSTPPCAVAPGVYPARTFLVHVDADAFFAQVEAARDASLAGLPVAVRQHGDVIAANAAAKAAGVTKHMAAHEAAALLRAVGGRLVHVHTTATSRVSYKPYRQASEALMALLRALPGAAVVERASIDEAFLLPAAAAAAAEDDDGGLRAAVALASAARAAAASQLGLILSAGVAPNKLLSKLASAAAKPDGTRVLATERDAAALLERVPAWRLPGAGGALASRLDALGIATAAQLGALASAGDVHAHELAAMLQCTPSVAAALGAAARGACSAPPVRPEAPPRSVSVGMTLSPRPLPMHDARATSATGGAPGVFTPLRLGERERVATLAAELGADLAERVLEHASSSRRWPRALALTADTTPPPPGGRSRQLPFPARPRGWPPPQAPAAADDAADADAEAALGAAIAATVTNALRASWPSDATVTYVMLLATKFERFEAGAGAITALLPPAVSPKALRAAAAAAAMPPPPAPPPRRELLPGAGAELGARALQPAALLRELGEGARAPEEIRAAAAAARARVARQQQHGRGSNA
jgi:nucleotidyltransferase/DNA polymerase involved in DNA repair